MRLAALVLALASLFPALAGAEATFEARAAFGSTSPVVRRLVLRGTTDVAPFAPVLERFASALPGLQIIYEQWGSNDLAARGAQACLGQAESSDLLISSSVDQIIKLANDGCARVHRSAGTDRLTPNLNWRNEVFGITREPAVMVYNRSLVPAALAPQSRFDLIDLLRPADSPYAGRVATYDIEASGLGYLFAFADSQQATTFGSLIEAFGRSGAVATCCSAEIIDGVADGTFAIAYNVLGSYASRRAAQDSNLAVVAPQDYTLVLSRAVMIPKAAPNPQDAAALIDFLLSPTGQTVLGQSGLIVDGVAEESGVVLRQIPLSPVLLLGLDQQKRRRFLELWRSTFPHQ